MSKKPKKSKKNHSLANQLLGKYAHRSLDAAWEKVANLCLFSFIDKTGKEIFVSNIEERDFYGQGCEDTFKSYSVFVPDDIVRRVAGKIGKAKNNKEVLTAYIDGSYSFSDNKGCCAYSVFFQVGDRIAEYANTVYDGTGRYGATASELMAAIVAIKVAVAFGYSTIDIRHDYNGVAFFADENDQEPNRNSKMYWIFSQYYAFLTCARKVIDIQYTKVRGHSLDIGNEHADFLARTYSKRGRKAIDAHLRELRRPNCSSAQLSAFARKHELKGEITFEEVEEALVEKDLIGAFSLTNSEYSVIIKMLHEKSTEVICQEMLLSRKGLADRRRSITCKLGMEPDAASDNTIVKRVLEWLYLELEGRSEEMSIKPVACCENDLGKGGNNKEEKHCNSAPAKTESAKKDDAYQRLTRAQKRAIGRAAGSNNPSIKRLVRSKCLQTASERSAMPPVKKQVEPEKALHKQKIPPTLKKRHNVHAASAKSSKSKKKSSQQKRSRQSFCSHGQRKNSRPKKGR